MNVDVDILHQLDVATIRILVSAVGQFLKSGRYPIEDCIEEIQT